MTVQCDFSRFAILTARENGKKTFRIKGEWKGDFSDQSQVWEKLLQRQQNGQNLLTLTVKNDGTFCIHNDTFLLGFLTSMSSWPFWQPCLELSLQLSRHEIQIIDVLGLSRCC